MQVRVVCEVIKTVALCVAALENEAFAIGQPGDWAAIGTGLGLGDLQQLRQSLAVLAQQCVGIGFDTQADGGTGNADDDSTTISSIKVKPCCLSMVMKPGSLVEPLYRHAV